MVVVESFQDSGMQVKKAKLLIQEVTKNNEALTFAHASLCRMYVTLDETIQTLDLDQKRI